MLSQRKSRRRENNKKENNKHVSLNIHGGKLHRNNNNEYALRSKSTEPNRGTLGAKNHYSISHAHEPDLMMAPLTVPLLPQVSPRPIISHHRSPSPLRSTRSPTGVRLLTNRVYHYGTLHTGLANQKTTGPAQIQLLRPNNTPVSAEKLDLDRRGLTSWPNLPRGEEPVRLLSLQHNLLTRVDPPFPYPNVVLLDLYHNHIHSLIGLQSLPNLRVLMLAKNRLTRLDGLEVLVKLEVLDLHGNQLNHLYGLYHLKDLRLLNLAGNMIRHVSGLRGLDSLSELNLRRNLIRTVTDFHYLPRLEKLFLGFNEITKFEDIACLQNCLKLKELSLEENPLSKQLHYFHLTINKFYRLKKLDDQEVTMETRKQSEKVLQKARERERAHANRISDEEKRKSAINNAMRLWKTVKNERRKLSRKYSEGTSENTSKESDSTESGFCGDCVSEEETEGRVDSIGDTDSLKPNSTEEKISVELKNLLPQDLMVDDDKLSQVSYSSGISEESCPSGASALKQNNNAQRSNPNSKLPPRTLSRSKSYTDIKFVKQKKFATNPNSRPMSGKRILDQATFNPPEKISLDSGSNVAGQGKTLSLSRRNSSSKLVPKKLHLNDKTKTNPDQPAKSATTGGRALKASSKGHTISTDVVISAAITQVQNNLCLPSSPKDAKNSGSSSLTPSEHSEMDTSDGEISSSSSNSPPSTSRMISELKIPLSRPKEIDEIVSSSDKCGSSSNSGILREQGPNFLAELEGEILCLYGQGALKVTELSWDRNAAGATTTARFQYMNFDDIIDSFPKLRVRFPRSENFSFVETNLAKYSQLNTLAELHKITEDDKCAASAMFSSLSQLAFTCLPRDQLSAFLSMHPSHSTQAPPILTVGNKDESAKAAKAEHESEGEESGDSDDNDIQRPKAPHLQELIGKEALQYRATSRLSQDEMAALTSSGKLVKHLMVWSFDSIERYHLLRSTWPSVLHDLIREAVHDLCKPNYGKQCLDDLRKNLGWKK